MRYMMIETKRTGVIYIAVSKSTGEPYIGQTVKNLNERKSAHKSSARNSAQKGKCCKLYEAINIYGFDDFDWAIIASNIPEERLDLEEICAIYIYDSYYNGLNSTFGGTVGNRGYKHKEETKHKMKKPRSENGRKNIWAASQSKRGKPSWNKGLHPYGEETKQKIRNARALQTIIITQETKLKIGEANTKFEFKIIKPNGEIEITTNMSQYCRDNNLNQAHMSAIAAGKRKRHKGYKCEKIRALK